MKRATIGLLVIPFMISCQNSQSKTTQDELLTENFDVIDCDIKTNKRPDGNVIKYFNPAPIVENNKYDIALSLYLNETTSTYFISVAVRFKSMLFKNLTDDLWIQTDSSDSIKITQVLNHTTTMNGEV